jgi:hypothetical protein
MWRFRHSLELTEPVCWCRIDQVENPCDGSSGAGKVMHEIGILECGCSDRLSSWSWHVSRNFFIRLPVHTVCPIVGLVIQMRVVWDLSTEADGTIRILLEISADATQSFEMSFLGSRTESPHRHGGTENIVSSEGNGPLERTDQTLVVFDFFGACFLSHIKFWMIILVNRRGVFFR